MVDKWGADGKGVSCLFASHSFLSPLGFGLVSARTCDRPRRTMGWGWNEGYRQGGWNEDDAGWAWKKKPQEQGPDNRPWSEKYTYLNGPAKANHTLPVEDRCWLVREIARLVQKKSREEDVLKFPVVCTLSWPADIVDAVLYLMTGLGRRITLRSIGDTSDEVAEALAEAFESRVSRAGGKPCCPSRRQSKSTALKKGRCPNPAEMIDKTAKRHFCRACRCRAWGCAWARRRGMFCAKHAEERKDTACADGQPLGWFKITAP